MLPTRPEGISAELWNLELPSILGAAHAEFREPSDPLTSPHSPAHSPPSYQSTQLDQESEPEDVPTAEPHPAACSTPPLVGDLDGPHDTKVQDDLAVVSSSSSRSGPAPSPGSGFTSPETHLLDWNVAECQMHLVLDSSMSIDFSGLPSPSHEADRLAQSILALGTASFVDIAKLLDLLPSATNAKRRRNKCEQCRVRDPFQPEPSRLVDYSGSRIPRSLIRGLPCFSPLFFVERIHSIVFFADATAQRHGAHAPGQ